ncbi:MAG: sporulation integral membrane protein YlbJ [Bacillota bacterium]|jgi:sporulation integral membrane protein YlbJ|nr:sporulation integral membrane protein YlbJ [Bacillota bacterium]HPZ21678.1 sporulation integral membrane protein YlbJ [Bacillota bacterium]HQD19515.1 sporulation integral membrane protein YlbJ [Bacillota bacterium]
MRAKYYLAPAAAFFLIITFVTSPAITLEASARGLDLWWNIVLPSLLPFFVAAELLTGLGAVHFLGVLLEPLMRPLFRVPGIGGFIFALGIASGSPMGAMLTARYRSMGALSKEEGERLMSFANTAGPLFITGAVATGMLGWPEIGVTLLLVHYLSSISTGLVMGFYKVKALSPAPPGKGKFILARAAQALVTARNQDGRHLGKLLSDAITKGINSLLLVGGFITCFSVLIELLNASGLIPWLASVLAADADVLEIISAGILELTNGCREASQSSLPLAGKLIAISAILAWSGLSVQGQAASFCSSTDLSLKPYLLARGIQAGFAALYTALLLKINWIPPLPAAVIDFVRLGLGTKYLVSLAYLGAVLLALTAMATALGLVTTCLQLKVFAFRVNQRN